MKRIVALSFITLGGLLQAQNIGNSPYAAFGLGDLKYDNTVENSAMAGISTAYISDFNNSFNFNNPAANENLQLTSIKFEATNENNFFTSDFNNYNSKKSSAYLSNLSIAFPLSEKIKLGLGYQPYTSKRYDILTTQALGNGTLRANRYRGEGSVSTVQAAISYQYNSEFAFGIRSNFYFGNLYDIDELSYSNAELINGYETKYSIKNFNFTLGTTYQKKYTNDRKLTLGATGTFGNTNKPISQYTNSTYYYNSYEEKIGETVVEKYQKEEKNMIPLEFSLGAGFGHTARWFVGSQIDFRKGQTVQYMGNDVNLKDSYKFAVGGWVLPNANNFRNYFQRVTYRYGAYFEKGQLNLNNTDINELGITLGATFPFKNASYTRMSGLDLAIELGKRGTVKNNLVNQNFINIKIGFNFADKWFMKRLYN